MTDQTINTTSPGPAVPQDRVLLPTPWEPFSAPALGSSAGAQSTSIPPKTLQVLPTHWSAGLFSSHPFQSGVKAIPRAAPNQHTLGPQSTAGNAGAASAGPDLRVLRENIPSRGVGAGKGWHRLCMARRVRGRREPGRTSCCWAEARFGDADAGGCRRWERSAERGYKVCKIVQGLR